MSKESNADKKELLQKIVLFAWLDERKLEFLIHRSECRLFAPQEIILKEETPGVQFCAIGKGTVEVVSQAGTEQENVLTTLIDGDFFGEMSIVGPAVHRASFRALEETLVLGIGAGAFREFSALYPDQYALLISNVARYFSKTLRDINNRIGAEARAESNS